MYEDVYLCLSIVKIKGVLITNGEVPIYTAYPDIYIRSKKQCLMPS